MTPKDYITYIDKDTNETRAVLCNLDNSAQLIEDAGHKIIGYVSSPNEHDAIKYTDEVLR